MISERPILTFIILSLAVHGVILTQSPNFAFFQFDQPKKLEVTYIKAQKAIAKPQGNVRKLPESRKVEPPIELPKAISQTESMVQKSPPPFVDKQAIFKRNRIIARRQSTFAKPSSMVKPDTIAIRKKVDLPPIDLEKANNPSYISYYQIVREKIRRAAYQNYTRTEMGEVYLSFVVSSQGYVREVHIVNDKSSDSLFLREIALLSVRDASPFPAFPKDLDYPQLSFNVVVSFEVE